MSLYEQKNILPTASSDALAFQAENTAISVERWQDGDFSCIVDPLSTELPVLVRYGEELSGVWTEIGQRELWAWPHLLHELAIGDAILEGRQGDSLGFSVCEENVPEITSASGLPFHSAFKVTVSRLLAGSGLSLSLTPQAVVEAMRSFMGAPGLWDDTGCFHRAGIFDPRADKVLKVAEDIGRHNCIDRLTGWSALNKVALGDYILLVSARMSASLCRKALKAGFRFLISRSAVTTASIAMCQEAGATLLGFARDKEERFTLFVDKKGWLKRS